MWVEKTKSGKFKACERYTDPLTGKEKRVSVTIEKDTRAFRREANKILEKRIDKALSASDFSRMTLGDLTEKFLEFQKHNTKPSTLHVEQGCVERLARILGSEILVNELTAGIVSDRIRRSLSKPSTINSYYKLLKQVISWGYSYDYIESKDWLAKIRPAREPGKTRRIEDKYLEVEELSKLLDGMTVDLWRILTKFLALSGLRIGEAIALTLGDIDEQFVHVTKTYQIQIYEMSDTPKSADSIRDVYIQPELAEALTEIRSWRLRQQLSSGIRTDLLFFNRTGGPISYYSYGSYLRRHGKNILERNITPHVLRHTHASLLASQGVPLETISHRLGHADSSITRDIYIHVTRCMKEREYEQIRKVSIL